MTLTPADQIREGDARVADALDDENSGPPELRMAVVTHRARVAQSLAALPLPRAS